MSAARGLLDRRRAGVLLHPTSLPSPYGAGDLGHSAFRFVEFLAAAGVSVWQLLPLGPTHPDRSPYDAVSAFAGNPELISLDWLHDRGFLDAAMLSQLAARERDRASALAAAAAVFASRLDEDATLAADLDAFRERQAYWLEDYTLFVALREAEDDAPWYRWPLPRRTRDPAALADARAALATRIDALVFEQYVFDRQWRELADYAARVGVHTFGDIPIFVSHDSADVWAHPDLFRLSADGSLPVETGVPPDYFSADGQRWGNPHYDEDAMAREGYRWWRARVALQRERFALLRIDHFRGFEACWEIPQEATHAAQGRWIPGAGTPLLDALSEVAGPGGLVAENLGTITEAVEALRLAHHMPGMLVFQFGFDGNPHNPHLPHNHVQHAVVYTGTHDNDTALGWFLSLDEALRECVRDYLGHPAEPMPQPLVRAVLASVAALAVVPMQDLLGLDGSARMNRPGLARGNWGWQLPDTPFDAALAARFRRLLSLYGRLC